MWRDLSFAIVEVCICSVDVGDVNEGDVFLVNDCRRDALGEGLVGGGFDRFVGLEMGGGFARTFCPGNVDGGFFLRRSIFVFTFCFSAQSFLFFSIFNITFTKKAAQQI